MSEFIPLSQIDPDICVLPVPSALDPNTIGVNLQRFKRIAAMSGFIADSTRITAVSGELSTEAIGVAGTSGNAAFGAAVSTASKAKTADFESGDPRPEGFLSNRVPTPLLITLNSTEIAAQAQATGKPVRQAETWARPIDKAIRQQLSRAAWKNMLTQPTLSEFVSTSIGSFISGLAYMSDGVSLPTTYGAIMMYAHTTRAVNVLYGRTRWDEAHFSLFPYYHIDRAAAVSARLACSKLVKAL